jgi:3-dehydroquinate synthase
VNPVSQSRRSICRWPAAAQVVPVRLGPRSYDFVVGNSISELLCAAASTLNLKRRRCAVLFDSNTARLFGRETLKSLAGSRIDARRFSIPAGERSKTLKQAMRFVDFMLSEGLDRMSFVVVVGGGVPGDLGAFAASIFMRGIPILQVPTTLLAQVDASLGGKTGVNLPAGKNLLGTFWQPLGVLAVPKVLSSLTSNDFASGLAEVAKYAMISGEGLLRLCERNQRAILERDPATMRLIVAECARIKAKVVCKDEREEGLRTILNYGHTVGHAIEAESGYRRVGHGHAVSIGMVAAAEVALRAGLVSEEFCERQRSLLESFGLPVTVPPWAQTDALMERIRFDKKRMGGKIRLVLPEGVGAVLIDDNVSPRAMRTGIEAARVTRKRR